ncbi:FG-GAP-like repeat-containing protein [Urechidicola sp. KH5]
MLKKFAFCCLFIFSFLLVHSQISFTENAVSLGVTASYNGNAPEYFAGGVSFVDFDDDGWDDLTFSSTDGESVHFYKNNNGTFSEIFPTGILITSTRTMQVLWIDYDNDGDKDFFMMSHDGGNKLFKNNGSFEFSDSTTNAGISTSTNFGFGASWGDYNNDGYLDLLLLFRDEETDSATYYNTLYKNDGDGTFTDVTNIAGLPLTANLSFCAAFFDYDNDGYQDIYISNDKANKTNIMYHNNGDGTFTDTSVSSGTDLAIDAMSTTISDYNNDGFLDIYVTNSFAGNAFLENNGDGTFTDIASANGTLMESWAWGAVFLDADNDQDADLYVSAMLTYDPSILLPSAFYVNDGAGDFSIPMNAGFANDNKISFANAIGDVNNDGFPEIVVVNRESNHFVFENNSSSNNYLKVKLEGTTGNKDGIGSWVKAYKDGEVQNRYSLAGEGFISQNSLTEFIGLGSETQLDSLEIHWLSGIKDIYYDVSANQTFTAVEGASLSIDNNLLAEFQIFPNPVKNELKLQLSGNLNGVIEIFNAFGSKIKEIDVNNKNSLKFDTSNFATGIYSIVIKSSEYKSTKKFIKY